MLFPFTLTACGTETDVGLGDDTWGVGLEALAAAVANWVMFPFKLITGKKQTNEFHIF